MLAMMSPRYGTILSSKLHVMTDQLCCCQHAAISKSHACLHWCMGRCTFDVSGSASVAASLIANQFKCAVHERLASCMPALLLHTMACFRAVFALHDRGHQPLNSQIFMCLYELSQPGFLAIHLHLKLAAPGC